MRRHPYRWAAVGMAVVIVALIASPAVGGPAFLTLPKAKKTFFTKPAANKRFITKAAAGARFLDPAEGDARYLDTAEGDARYLRPGAGPIRLAIGSTMWQPDAQTSANPTWLPERARISTADGDVDQRMVAAPALPISLFGTTLELTGMELCYSAPTDLVLDSVEVQRMTQTIDATQAGSVVLQDPTDRLGGDCRTYAPTAAVPLGPSDTLAVVLTVDNPLGAGAQTFSVGRTTLLLEP